MVTITPYLIHHTEKEKNNFKDFRLATRFYARKERGVGGRECSQRKRTKKKGGDDVTKKKLIQLLIVDFSTQIVVWHSQDTKPKNNELNSRLSMKGTRGRYQKKNDVNIARAVLTEK